MGLFSWLRKDKPSDDMDADWKRRVQQHNEIIDRGWVPFCNAGPHAPSPLGQMIDIRTLRDDTIITMNYADMHPMMNVADTYWRQSVFNAPGKMIEGEVIAAHPASSHARLP